MAPGRRRALGGVPLGAMDEPKPSDKPTCDQCGSENLVREYKDVTAFGSGGRERIPACLCASTAKPGRPEVIPGRAPHSGVTA